MRPMFISAKSALAGAVQRLLADADSFTYPITLEVRSGRRMSSAQQAIVHSLLRDISRHAQAAGIPATEESVKAQAKANQIEGVTWPGAWVAGFGSDAVWIAKGTMELSSAECRDLIDQIGAFMGEHGITATGGETWNE